MSESIIVIGVDGTPSSAAALRWAAAEAARRGSWLRAIHVYDPPRIVGAASRRRISELATAMRAEAHAWVVEALGEDRTARVTVDAIPGDPGPVLVEAANRADLLVLGVRGYGRYSYLAVPKVARFCLGRCRAPVVVVPAPAAMEAVRSA